MGFTKHLVHCSLLLLQKVGFTVTIYIIIYTGRTVYTYHYIHTVSSLCLTHHNTFSRNNRRGLRLGTKPAVFAIQMVLDDPAQCTLVHGLGANEVEAVLSNGATVLAIGGDRDGQLAVQALSGEQGTFLELAKPLDHLRKDEQKV